MIVVGVPSAPCLLIAVAEHMRWLIHMAMDPIKKKPNCSIDDLGLNQLSSLNNFEHAR